MSSLENSDKRQRPRWKTYLAGDITVNNDMLPEYCLVKDISHTGCMISVESKTSVPDEFVLDLSNGETKYCSVVWRSGNKIGVEFL